MPQKKTKGKGDAPLSFHLRVWDPELAAFIKEQAEKSQRHQYQQVILFLRQAMERHNAQQ